jgi:hypothetical protein
MISEREFSLSISPPGFSIEDTVNFSSKYKHAPVPFLSTKSSDG